LGATFFSGEGRGDGEGSGVSAGVGDGVSSAADVGDGLVFFRFDFFFGVGLGDGVGEAFFRFGEAVGDGVGVGFFAVRLRCFRVGVGDGWKSFLIFVSNDSSAAFAVGIAPNNSAKIRSHFIPVSFRAKSRNLWLLLQLPFGCREMSPLRST
jgi:hypothetical protein